MLFLKSSFNRPGYRSLLKSCLWAAPLLLSLVAGTGMRLWEVPEWDRPGLTAAGEPLLSKHDGYGWLAGAKQINQHSSAPFSICIRLLNETTGISFDRIAFWLPAVAAPLAAIPAFALALWWGIPEAGLVAGIMAGSSIGYFIRTRVTCLDTDLITLLFPLCLAAGLMMWIESVTPPPRGRGDAPASGAILFQALLLGLLFRCYLAFYPSGESVGLCIIATALAVGMIFPKSSFRLLMACGILMVCLVGSGRLPAAVLGAGVVVLSRLRPGLFVRKGAAVWLLLGLLAAWWWFSDLGAAASDLWFHLSRYGRMAENGGPAGLPSVIDTVPEAWPVSLDGAVFFMAGNRPLFIAGLAGLAIVLWKRPSALLLLPLLALGLASVKLGIRFTMYGGGVLGIGLACGTALWLRGIPVPFWGSMAAQLILLMAVCHPLVKTVDAVDPEPVISKPLATALLDLKQHSAPDAQVWIWWDKGYAAQYYAERMTLADGYRNSAEAIFPLAYAHTADTPLSAYQMMARCALLQQAEGPVESRGSRFPIYPNPFVDLIPGKVPGAMHRFLGRLKQPGAAWSHDLPEQYLVLTWEGLKRAHTILSYGTWDFENGRPGPGNFMVVRERAAFDMPHGTMKLKTRTYPLKSRTIIAGSQKKRFAWPQENGRHAVSIKGGDVTFLMDDAAYRTMMVQMLLTPPEDFLPYFDLVIDRFPLVRIYRVNPILTRLPPGTILPERTRHDR